MKLVVRRAKTMKLTSPIERTAGNRSEFLQAGMIQGSHCFTHLKADFDLIPANTPFTIGWR